MKHHLFIIVHGGPGSGKTALAFALKWYLKLWGFNVEVEDAEGDQDRPAEHHYHAMSDISTSRSVVIKTIQTRTYDSLPK